MEYDVWVEEGKRNTVKKALLCVAKDGLNPPHRLFISFRTQCKDVKLTPGLREQYPEEMRILLEDSFWNLSVTDHSFSVELLFDEVKETISIPFYTLVEFIDPEENFSLRFNWQASMPSVTTGNVIFTDRFKRK